MYGLIRRNFTRIIALYILFTFLFIKHSKTVNGLVFCFFRIFPLNLIGYSRKSRLTDSDLESRSLFDCYSDFPEIAIPLFRLYSTFVYIYE